MTFYERYVRPWRAKNPHSYRIAQQRYKQSAKGKATAQAYAKKFSSRWSQLAVLCMKRRRNRRALTMDAIKRGRPCFDCAGFYEPCQLQWDHRDPTAKRATISSMVNHGFSMPEILKEVSKCDLVCANCHALRTQKQWRLGILKHTSLRSAVDQVQSSPTQGR